MPFRNDFLFHHFLEFIIEPFHLGTRRVAEVVPHLGLPVRGPIRRQAL